MTLRSGRTRTRNFSLFAQHTGPLLQAVDRRERCQRRHSAGCGSVDCAKGFTILQDPARLDGQIPKSNGEIDGNRKLLDDECYRRHCGRASVCLCISCVFVDPNAIPCAFTTANRPVRHRSSPRRQPGIMRHYRAILCIL